MAQSVDVINERGDVILVKQEISDSSVLWSELFNEKERIFLREHLKSESVGIAAKEFCHVKLRTLWQRKAPPSQGGFPAECTSPSATFQQRKTPSLTSRRPGKVVLMLHAVSGGMTSSWTWMKLAVPLYKQGFSVISLDLPGFGCSSAAQDPCCPPSRWMSYDWEIVSGVLDQMGVSRCSILATGETCSTVLRLLQHVPSSVARYHVFHNPILRLDELFPKASPTAFRGLPGQQDEQYDRFEALLAENHVRIWALFNEVGAGPTKEAYDMLTRAKRSKTVLRFTIGVTKVTREHLCQVTAGARVPVQILFPCKYLRRRLGEFLEERQCWMPEDTLPEGCAGETSTAASSSRTFQSDAWRGRGEASGAGRASLAARSPTISEASVRTGLAGSSSEASLPRLPAQHPSHQWQGGALASLSPRCAGEVARQLPRLGCTTGQSGESTLPAVRDLPWARRSMSDFAREAIAMQAPDPGPARERRLVRHAAEAARQFSQQQTDFMRQLDCQTAEQGMVLRAMQASMYSLEEDEARRTKNSWGKFLRRRRKP